MKNNFRLTLMIVIVLLHILFCNSQGVLAQNPPYPPGPVFSGVTWYPSTLMRKASGSDIWTTTWASDGNIYTSWGDGNGFGVSDAGLGVARIEGTAENFVGTNVWSVPRGFTGGKSNALLSVNGVLYMAWGPNSGWSASAETYISYSNNLGSSWQVGEETFFSYMDGFSDITFLQFGKDYEGARDNYVYAYSADLSEGESGPFTDVLLVRVPEDQITNRSAYEIYMGLDGNNNPLWTVDFGNRKPIFTNQIEGVKNPYVIYNPVIKRYIMIVMHGTPTRPLGGLGMFDAPEPWGPWTTVEYTDNWMGSTNMFNGNIPTKWMSTDGLTFWMVFTGYGDDVIAKDAYQHMKGVFTISNLTPPATPTVLTIQ